MRGLSPAAAFSAVLASPVFTFISFFALRMSTPGWCVSIWRAQIVDNPSMMTGLLVAFLVDCCLWFIIVWGAYSLFRGARSRREENASGLLLSIACCAFPLGLFTATGLAGYFPNAAFARSLPLLGGCALLAFVLFSVIILQLYSVGRSAAKPPADSDRLR